MGWLGEAVLVVVPGAVGSCFLWVIADAAVSVLLCPCLSVRVLVHVSIFDATMLRHMSAIVVWVSCRLLASAPPFALCLPLKGNVVFLLLDGVFALSGTPLP